VSPTGAELSVIGKATPKKDGADKVSGRTQFIHDLALPRMAHGAILRARFPHARLARIDATRARAVPGVLAVITGADVEQQPFGFAKDQLALKRGTVRSVRDEIAASRVSAATAAISSRTLRTVSRLSAS